MTANEREQWLKAARMALSGIPADLLADGCAEARKRCRFPSEIVPTILEAIGRRWGWRKADAKADAPKRLPAPRDEVETIGANEVAKLLETLAGKLAA